MCRRLSFVYASVWRHSRALALSALIVLVWPTGRAAEPDKFHVPDALRVDGETLHLNGMGLRTSSIFSVPVYVAWLYLRHLSTDAKAILQSSETKLLIVRFKRDVGADLARRAWREGLEKNCKAPCHLDPGDLRRFLAGVPDMHRNDTYSLLFTQSGVTVEVNGRNMAVISRPRFGRAMLATFLGPEPASPMLKQRLLQGGQGVQP
jgi:Chalcone isomerase-like